MKTILLLPAACAALISVNAATPGGDKDEHGCVGSAGYEWCQPLNKCIQPFVTTCPSDAKTGGDKDEHGCIGSAGYEWCQSLDKCIKPFETKCPPDAKTGGDKDEHGCIGSAGYSWCQPLNKCIRSFETTCDTSNSEADEQKNPNAGTSLSTSLPLFALLAGIFTAAL